MQKIFKIIYVINSEKNIVLDAQKLRKEKKKSFFSVANPTALPSGVLSATEMLDSILKEEENCPYQVEIDMYDICCTKTTQDFGEAYVKKYPGRVSYQQRLGKSVFSCYNEGLDQNTEASYINLTKATTLFDGKEIAYIYRNLQSEEVQIVSLTPFQYTNEKMYQRVAFEETSCVINIQEKPFHRIFYLDCLFMKREAVGDLRFDETHAYEIQNYFLIELYEKAPICRIQKGICKLCEYLQRDAYNYAPTHEKEWYTEDVKNNILPFLRKRPDSVIRQAAIVYLVELKFWANGDDRNKNMLDKQETEEFYDTVASLFQHIEDDVLVQYKWNHIRILQPFMGINFLRMKYRNYEMQAQLQMQKKEPFLVMGPENTIVQSLRDIQYKIFVIDYEKEHLIFEGEVFKSQFADSKKIRFQAYCDNRAVETRETGIYRYEKYFGQSVKKGYMVQVRIPVQKIRAGSKIRFTVEFEGQKAVCSCDFCKLQSRFHNEYRDGYWKFGNYLLKYQEKGPYFYIEKAKVWNLVKSEIQFEKRTHNKRALMFRMVYFLTKPIYGKKNIWLTYDQLFKGGDNGEYFFRYVREHHGKETDIYYIANQNSREYKELKKKYGKVLPYHSIRLLLMSLHAKMIFATRVDVRLYCGFTKTSEAYIRDLFQAKVVCLQHGLTIQKIAQYQNRLFDNTKYYFCVSPYEVENIQNDLYGYDESMISLTGAPRYDGLTGTPKRQILITPTWRRSVTAGTNVKGSSNDYSVSFKNTVYYQIYNSLINDKKLIASAKKNHYKLVYLIHPILSPQADDFEKNEYVEIRPGIGVNYEQILKESSLMVTDYSGIQFDFAYMRRPLVYYHPDKLPPQYEEGKLKYDTMGFGPVCKKHEEIVDTLCYFMERNCELDEKYRERIEDFFPYDDQENCRRVYEAALEYQKNCNL